MTKRIYFYFLFIGLITSCSTANKIKNSGEYRHLKTGEIMEMNSEEFLIHNNAWELKSTEHFKFFFDKSIDKKLQDNVIKSQELNYSELAILMGISEIELTKINFWLFKDKAQKEKLTLVASDAHAISTFPSVYYLPKNATGGQEVGHVMTQSYWGFIPKTSNYALVIDEGFNYYIDNKRFYKEKLIEKVKILNSKKSVSILKLVNENNGKRIKGVQSGSHEVDESLIAGAFTQFIIEKYGIEKFSILWKKALKKESADSIIYNEVYNKDISELNNEFIMTLK